MPLAIRRVGVRGRSASGASDESATADRGVHEAFGGERVVCLSNGDQAYPEVPRKAPDRRQARSRGNVSGSDARCDSGVKLAIQRGIVIAPELDVHIRPRAVPLAAYPSME